MTLMVDPHSSTWKAVLQFINQEGEDAISALVADQDSEQQRGALKVLERLSKLADKPAEPVVGDDYA